MSSFSFNVSDMLAAYGTDIYVITPDKLKSDLVGGIYFGAGSYSGDMKEKRHEPIIPASSNSAIIAQLVKGGTIVQFDLLWLSTGEFPKNTLVEVPSQGGIYRVMRGANWSDYTNPHFFEYQLKGDSNNGAGKQPATTKEPIPTSLYSAKSGSSRS